MTMRIFLLVFASIFPFIGAMAYFFWWPGLATTQIIYSASKGVQFLWPVTAWALLARDGGFRVASSEVFAWRRRAADARVLEGWLVSLALSLLTLVAGYFAYVFYFADVLTVPEVRLALNQKLSEFGVTNVMGYVALGFFIAVLHSFLEEYYWRGYVMNQFLRVMSERGWLSGDSHNFNLASIFAVTLSAVAFTLHHVVVIANYARMTNAIPIIIFASLVVFFFGILWAWHYKRYRNIYAVWVSHIAADIVMLGIGYHIVYM